MKWFYLITGGRPMDWRGFSFTDVVVNKPVHHFVDKFGRHWMANHRWSYFRVPMK